MSNEQKHEHKWVPIYAAASVDNWYLFVVYSCECGKSDIEALPLTEV